MSEVLTIRPAGGTYVVRAGGAVIAETTAALLLEEKGYDGVVYFPREDIGMAFLEPSDKTTHCPHKGDARYFHIVAKSGPIQDAGWSYEAPIAGVEAIAGHIAFAHERVAVERL
ncbi:MAG: DUF427 domain-containing protein [Pseudomonadota bacterium]